MNVAALASIGLAVGVAGGLVAWLVRTTWGRAAGVLLLVAAVALEAGAVLAGPPGADQGLGPPTTLPFTATSPSPSATPSTTPSGVGPTTIQHEFLAAIHFRPDFTQTRPGRVWNAQFALLENRGTVAVNLAGWKLTSQATGASYTFPSVTIGPNGQISVHGGSGTNTSDTLHMNRSSSAFASSDTVRLYNANGALQDTCHYLASNTQNGVASCA